MMLSKKKFALVSAAVILAGTICFTVFRFVIPGLSDMPASGDEASAEDTIGQGMPGMASEGDPDGTSAAGTYGPSGTVTIEPSSSPKPLMYEIDKPFELIPEDADGRVVGTDSGYFIKLGNIDYTVDQLAEKITIIPETRFKISRRADRQFYMEPETALTPDKIYSFTFNDDERAVSYSWAFQSRREFIITSMLPRHQATHVPVETGIEITFSLDDIGDPADYFKITPATKGRFEIHDRTVVFVPDKPLSYDTVYTVTVKKGLPLKSNKLSLKEDTVFSFQTVPEPDPVDYGYSCQTMEFARRLYNLYPHETPALSIRTNIDKKQKVEFNLYKYASAEEFKKDVYLNDDRPHWCVNYDSPIEIEGKEKVLSLTTGLISPQEEERYYLHTRYLELPSPLPEGYYIASIKTEGLERRAYIQVNAMAVYVGAAANKTLALVYDSEHGVPVENAEIVFDNFTMKTGQDGLAVSDKTLYDPELFSQTNYEIRREGHPSYFCTIGRSDGGYRTADNYLGYLFTDRYIYLPSDTVNVWGIVAGKDGIQAPGKVTVSLYSGNYYYSNYTWSPMLIDEKEVEISDMGTFKTEFPYENLDRGNYTIRVQSGGTTFASKSIGVQKFEKPIYVLKTGLDTKYAVNGDTIEFSMGCNFFEGTPVNGMNFKYNIYCGIYSGSNSGMLTTDADGRATLSFTAQYNTESWLPLTGFITVTNADGEEREVRGTEYFKFFPKDTMLKVHSQTDENMKCTVNLFTNKIDVDAVKRQNLCAEHIYKGEPADVDLMVELYETYYVSTQIGTYYDFINKKTYPKYSYELVVNKIRTLNLSSKNGKADFEFIKEKSKGYYIVTNYRDGLERPVTQQNHLYSAYYNDTSKSWRKTDTYYLALDNGNIVNRYAEGDTVTSQLYLNGEPYTGKDNSKTLFMLFRKGLLDYELTEDTSYSFTFKTEYIPNVWINAIHFDGKYMKSLSLTTSALFDEETRRLNIEVVPSSTEYRPGDTAQFDITVTDQSGKGRVSEVLFSIVDEAYFAIYPQSINILYSIYSKTVSRGYIGTSIPYTNTLDDYIDYPFAECGEGGDEGNVSVRSDFKDTAIFKTVVTDSNGHARLEVRLPDNLTKWRVSYQGITRDLYAGNGLINIDARLPYFVNTIFNDVFIEGDKPVLQLRSFGTSVIEGGEAEYTVSITKDGEPWKEYSASSTTDKKAYVVLDKLEVGSYSYTVTGKYGDYRDAIMHQFEVLPGFIEQQVTRYDTLTGDIEFPEIKWPATVYFFNENVKSYYCDLIDLARSYGKRIDQVIVREQARSLLREYFGSSWQSSVSETDLSGYQFSNGGIALLPYDSANPVLTAKICSLSYSGFNYDRMKNYFYRTLESNISTSTDIAAAYWGLAILREPVLSQLDDLAQSPGLLLADRLYIGLAYAWLGDIDSAAEIYNKIIENNLAEDTLRAFINAPDEKYDSDDIQEATSLCALLSGKMGVPERQKLFEYVSNMCANDILTGAMRLMFIKDGLKNVSMESSFTYEIDGKKEFVKITGIGTYRMVLTAERIKKIKFSDIKGKITVATVYTAPIGVFSDSDIRLSILKNYLDKDKKYSTEFKTSDYIKVVLNVRFLPTMPAGYYIVEDYLPASFKYVSYNYQLSWTLFDGNRVWYPHEIFGQKVSFCIYHNNKGPLNRTIEYYVRVINPGEYTAESAAVYNLESNITAYSPRTIIKVE